MSVAIFGLWRNWAIGVGFLTLLTFVAPLLSHGWLLVMNIAVWLALQWIRAILKHREVPSCSRFMQDISTTILITTCIVAFVYFGSRMGLNFKEASGEDFTLESPMLIVLISSPVVTLVSACFLFARNEPLVCQQCKLRYGNVIECGFIGALYRREWQYQTRLLMCLGLSLSVIVWGYYLLHYVNVNLNRSDYFYFLWLPLVIYVLTLIYLGCRYYSIWEMYCQNDEGHYVTTPGATRLRYLLICRDHIFINLHMADVKSGIHPGEKCFDTPAKVRIPYREREDISEARRLFESVTGIHEADIRLIYSSPDPVTYQNIFHYFAFVDDENVVEGSKIRGEWLTLGELTQLINNRMASRELDHEFSRIYRVAMAWKTYDTEGRRLYNIKNYRPTFRLRDLRHWDVDYDDPTWLMVGEHNEDTPFFRLNRFFRQLTHKLRLS